MAFPGTGVPNSIVFEGKEVNLWTWGQLERLNKEKLRQRALNLRDAVGADRVPNPPHHEEALRMWILQTQCALTGHELADFGMRQLNAQGMPISRAASEAGYAGDTADAAMRMREVDAPPQAAGVGFQQGFPQESPMGGQQAGGPPMGGRPPMGGPPGPRGRQSPNVGPQRQDVGDDERHAAHLEAKRASHVARQRNMGAVNPITGEPNTPQQGR